MTQQTPDQDVKAAEQAEATLLRDQLLQFAQRRCVTLNAQVRKRDRRIAELEAEVATLKAQQEASAESDAAAPEEPAAASHV